MLRERPPPCKGIGNRNMVRERPSSQKLATVTVVFDLPLKWREEWIPICECRCHGHYSADTAQYAGQAEHAPNTRANWDLLQLVAQGGGHAAFLVQRPQALEVLDGNVKGNFFRRIRRLLEESPHVCYAPGENLQYDLPQLRAQHLGLLVTLQHFIMQLFWVEVVRNAGLNAASAATALLC